MQYLGIPVTLHFLPNCAFSLPLGISCIKLFMYQQYSMHPRIYGTCSILYVKGVCGVFGSRFAFCGSVAMNRVVQHQHKFRLINLSIRIYSISTSTSGYTVYQSQHQDIYSISIFTQHPKQIQGSLLILKSVLWYPASWAQ